MTLPTIPGDLPQPLYKNAVHWKQPIFTFFSIDR